MLGATLILLSFHDLFVVAASEMLVPINERSERPYFIVLGLVFAGLALVAGGCLGGPWRRRRDLAAEAREDADERRPA